MTSQLLQCIIFTVVVIHSVDAKWLSEIPNAPARGFSKVFSIPTWIAHIDDYDDDAFNATTIFSVVSITVTTLYVLYFISFVYLPTLPRNKRTIGPFNTLIVLYLVSTLFATFSFSLMNAGRIWAAFGVFHNLFEVGFLSFIMTRHKSLMQKTFVTVCFIYILSVMFIVIIIPWPLDAAFFKYQGLVVDFALVIDLRRLYNHNKAIYEKASVGTMVESCDCSDNGSNDDNNLLVQQLQKQLTEEQKQVEDDPHKHTETVPVHKNIFILYMAAFSHAAGNGLVTCSNHFFLWIIFQFIYAIAFPMYAYYCIIEPNASRVNFYKVDYTKEALVMISGATLAAINIAIGVHNSGFFYR